MALFFLYVAARNKGEHKKPASQINDKYALTPETLAALDKEFEKNYRQAAEEFEEANAGKKMIKKKLN